MNDATTSPERQLEHCQNLISARGWEHIGTAEDLDVSATKFSPFDRPKLGPWLTDTPPDDWDTLVVWRLDRLIRSSRDLSNLLAWCEERGKGFVSATEGFDLQTPFGKAMAQIIATLGELEADTIQMRVKDAHRALQKTDRLPSGVPPFGFVSVPHPDGRGFTYAKDPDMQSVIHDLASKLLDGWSLTALAHYLTENRILNNRDRSRIRNKKEPQYAAWQVKQVKSILSSPATQGIKMSGSAYSGKPILTSEGELIRVAPPTFDDETWELIQQKIGERSESGRRRVHSSNPMVGVGVCGVCGTTLGQNIIYRPNDRQYRYYRCNTNAKRCPGVVIMAHKMDRTIEAAFLLAEGDNRVREKVFIPGTDNRVEIDTLRASIRRLQQESDMGLIEDEGEYFARLRHLKARLDELEPEPYRPSQWSVRELNQTYREAWAEADTEGRRKLLQAANAKAYLYPGQRVELDIESGIAG